VRASGDALHNGLDRPAAERDLGQMKRHTAP
jgi:hypothetical protein